MELIQFILGIISLTFTITSVHSLKCFQCNSVDDESCLSLTSANTSSPYYKDCNETYHGHKPFCRKTVLSILDSNHKRTIRACAWEVYKSNDTLCYERDSDFKLERSCQCFHDGCNSAVQFGGNMFLPSIGAAFSFFSLYYKLS